MSGVRRRRRGGVERLWRGGASGVGAGGAEERTLSRISAPVQSGGLGFPCAYSRAGSAPRSAAEGEWDAHILNTAYSAHLFGSATKDRSSASRVRGEAQVPSSAVF